MFASYPLQKCLAAFIVVAVSGRVYAFGGYGIGGALRFSPMKGEPLAAAESFDPKTRLWREMPRLRRQRFGCAVVAVGGLFYGRRLWHR